MGKRTEEATLFCVALFSLWASSTSALLSPKGVNFEVQALMNIKYSLTDPHGILDKWDGDAVDPCSWTMVTCSSENLVTGLLLQNNNISGTIPSELGRLEKLRTLDLSNNFFTGEIPPSLAHLESLQYL
ncbi:hypothetical protein LguiA_032528 [Lonicera macranthoides]